MNKLSFWHKVAFIANICWLLTWVLKYNAFIPKGTLQSTIIVTGLVMSCAINLGANICTAILLFQKKLPSNIPVWLITINLIFLLPQLYLFFK